MATLSGNILKSINHDEEKLVRSYVYNKLKCRGVTEIVSVKCCEKYKIAIDIRDIDDIIKEKYYITSDTNFDDDRMISLNSVILMDKLYDEQSKFVLDIINSDLGKIDIYRKKTLTMLSGINISATIASLYRDIGSIIKRCTLPDIILTNPITYYLIIRSVCYATGPEIDNIIIKLPIHNIKHWSAALYRIGNPYKIESVSEKSGEYTVNILVK